MMISKSIIKTRLPSGYSTRSIFNFLKKSLPQNTTATATEAQAPQSHELTTADQQSGDQLKIHEEETQLLWDLYHPKEEEGLSVFDEALTNQIEEFKSVN